MGAKSQQKNAFTAKPLSSDMTVQVAELKMTVHPVKILSSTDAHVECELRNLETKSSAQYSEYHECFKHINLVTLRLSKRNAE